MFLHLSELDIRTIEHNRHLDDANRYGWLRSSTLRAARTMTLGDVLGAIGARFAPRALTRPNAGTHIGCDDPSAGSAVRSPG